MKILYFTSLLFLALLLMLFSCNNKFRLLIFYFALLISICSCKQNKMERALKFADNNRSELEKVLTHYENDPLKLKATQFLIENMPAHFSYDIPNYEKWKELKVKSVKSEYFTKEDSLEAYSYAQQTFSTKKIFDSHVITAKYLINNIDFSFKIWEERPWSKYYSFDDFCKTILPYRIGNEPLQSWKEAYYNEYTPLLDSLYKGKEVLECCNALVRYITSIGFPNNLKIPREPQIYDALFLLEHKVGGCKESTTFFTYMMRALGIPINIDIMFYSNELSQVHYWNSIKDMEGVIIPFWLEKNAEDVHIKKGNSDDDTRPKWKIYRKTYEVHKKKDNNLEGHFLSKILENPLLEDVTSDYYGEHTLTLTSNITKDKIFLTRHYSLPVDVSDVKKGKIQFHNIGIDMVYGLYYYSDDKLIAADYPFHFDGENIRKFIPDENNIKIIKLTRKTKLPQRIINHLDSAIGLKLQYIQTPAFGKGVDVLEIKDTIRTNYNNYSVNTSKKTRYIKCLAPNDYHLEVAELMFFRDSLMTDTIPYVVLNEDSLLSAKMHDNDPLSYYRSTEKNKSVIIDFQKVCMISKIQFVPRNDDNFIRIGDEYELLYHIDTGWGWKTLGKKKATTNTLNYEAPHNALLWLKNLTRGYEEQLFIYEDEKQVFMR